MKNMVVVLMLLLGLSVPGMAQTDVAKAAGLYEVMKSWSARVGDYNNDGWDDLIVSRHYEAGAQLFRNNRNGTFSEVFAGTFPGKINGYPVDRHDCEWGDVNRDGLLDIYCTKGSDYGTAWKENELWIQGSNGFVNKSKEYGVTDPWGRGRFCTFIDVNRDGYPDLFVANETGRADGQDSRNHLFMNEGGQKFVAAPQYGVDLAIGGGQCVKKADIDNDGWDDLLVCSGGGSTQYYTKLYHNNHGTSFTDISVQVGLSTQGYWRDVVVDDFDGDGQLDLAMVRTNKFQVMLQRSGKFVATFGYGLTAGEKLAAGDVNRDGLPDVYVVQGGDASTHITAVTNPSDMFFINHGNGLFAKILGLPYTWQGQGQMPIATDFNHDGKDDFVVLNGFSSHDGPTQLIKF